MGDNFPDLVVLRVSKTYSNTKFIAVTDFSLEAPDTGCTGW
jgi:hypothetical protein